MVHVPDDWSNKMSAELCREADSLGPRTGGSTMTAESDREEGREEEERGGRGTEKGKRK